MKRLNQIAMVMGYIVILGWVLGSFDFVDFNFTIKPHVEKMK